MSGIPMPASIAAACEITAVMFVLADAAARGRVPYSSLRVQTAFLACSACVLETFILSRSGSLAGIVTACVIACCAAAAATDLQTGYVFDMPTFATLIAILGLQGAAGNLDGALLGVCAAGGALGVLYALTRARGIGLGDVKLGCVIGAGFGVSGGLHSLQAAFIAGGVIAAYRLLTKSASRKDEIKFAPYLGGGAALICILGAFS